jgi:hypothetical protein
MLQFVTFLIALVVGAVLLGAGAWTVLAPFTVGQIFTVLVGVALAVAAAVLTVTALLCVRVVRTEP